MKTRWTKRKIKNKAAAVAAAAAAVVEEEVGEASSRPPTPPPVVDPAPPLPSIPTLPVLDPTPPPPPVVENPNEGIEEEEDEVGSGDSEEDRDEEEEEEVGESDEEDQEVGEGDEEEEEREGEKEEEASEPTVTEESEIETIAIRPMGMYFLSSEYTKKVKVSTRCFIVEVLHTLQNLRPEMNEIERKWFHTHPQFKHIPHAQRRKPQTYGYVDVSPSKVKIEKEKEAWFCVNGTPIRYRIREHALIYGLNCKNYPLGWKELGV